ncbi:MAG: SPOR domain-containing protein [bacterium]|nr:SPOR domain-containing protein [bacterium]
MQNLCLILLFTLSPLELYKDAKKAYTKGDFDGASRKVKRFLIQYPEHELTPYVLYWAGKLRKDQKEAISYYERILALYPNKVGIADSALYRIAQYYYAKGEYIEALKNYEKVVTSYPKGLCAKAAKEWIAIIYSFISPQAIRLVGDSANKYAVQVGAFQEEKNAEKLKESLSVILTLNEVKGKNLPYIVNEDNYYKVMIGEFSSREDAKKFMLENGLNGFVVRR